MDCSHGSQKEPRSAELPRKPALTRHAETHAIGFHKLGTLDIDPKIGIHRVTGTYGGMQGVYRA